MKPVFLTAFLVTASAFAQPHITSVSPSSGPLPGGTTVTIKGTGFDMTCTPDLLVCGQAAVTFGSLPATSFHIVDTQTIEAVTPASVPRSVTVTVTVARGGAQLADAFTYAGNVDDTFERVLFPVFVPETPGTFGTRFGSTFSMLNAGGPNVTLFGLESAPLCLPDAGCPPVLKPLVLPAHAALSGDNLVFDGNPGRLAYIPKGSFDQLATSLRLADASRLNESFGTRLPVVPERDFRSDLIALVDVPQDDKSNFRYTLRVYALDPGSSVHVAFVGNDNGVVLRETDLGFTEPADPYQVAYAEYSGFHPRAQSVRVEIKPATPGQRIWGFVSITNNVTQQITIVAPR